MAENKKRGRGERDDRLALPKDQVENLGNALPKFRFYWLKRSAKSIEMYIVVPHRQNSMSVQMHGDAEKSRVMKHEKQGLPKTY
jgi:hypothetical protein